MLSNLFPDETRGPVILHVRGICMGVDLHCIFHLGELLNRGNLL
jgi:hypothetical protein